MATTTRLHAPRVTHYILLQSWAIYAVDAEAVPVNFLSSGEGEDWIPVVATSMDEAKGKGAKLFARLTSKVRVKK